MQPSLGVAVGRHAPSLRTDQTVAAVLGLLPATGRSLPPAPLFRGRNVQLRTVLIYALLVTTVLVMMRLLGRVALPLRRAGRRAEEAGQDAGGHSSHEVTPFGVCAQRLCQPIKLVGVRSFAPFPHAASRRFIIQFPIQWPARPKALHETLRSLGSRAADARISGLSLPRVAKRPQVPGDTRTAERRTTPDADRGRHLASRCCRRLQNR